ncbi:prepilin-type N-terminal cleavage/methylation domain-containing protein [bacterium]|nr:prepilin-type N-terminal cleavage/methylation domain-containing protein [bacterium]
MTGGRGRGSGYSLMELMVVIAIVGIMTGLGIGSFVYYGRGRELSEATTVVHDGAVGGAAGGDYARAGAARGHRPAQRTTLAGRQDRRGPRPRLDQQLAPPGRDHHPAPLRGHRRRQLRPGPPAQRQ